MTLAVVTMEEVIGVGADSVDLTGFLHLFGADEHSGTTIDDYLDFPIDGTVGGVVYSYERWIRARFDTGFLGVRAYRFFSPTVASLPAGWTFKFGTTSSYATPVTTASTIATTALPSADPGRGSPNAGGASLVDGSTTRYSDWIVLQAIVDTDMVGGSGPAFGFDLGDVAIPIEYDFYWTESE